MKTLYGRILLFAFPLICGNQVIGQDKINFYGGLGIPEGYVLGIRFSINQIQLGLGFGYVSPNFTLSGDVAYHFGGSSQKSYIKPWYIKGGLSKWLSSAGDPYNYPLGFFFRAGRDINLSEKIGLNIEFGIIAGKLANELMAFGHTAIFPSLGLFFFYRI
jgi:hypothetical protein